MWEPNIVILMGHPSAFILIPSRNECEYPVLFEDTSPGFPRSNSKLHL